MSQPRNLSRPAQRGGASRPSGAGGAPSRDAKGQLPKPGASLTSSIECFATTSPGLEQVLRAELRELGYTDPRVGGAGCSFRTDRVGLERATARLTTAHRVLWTLGEVDASNAETLYQSVGQLVRWVGLIPVDKTFAVFATARDNHALHDHRFVALRIKDAIVDAVRAADPEGRRPSVDADQPDVVVRVSVVRGRGIVSLDAAGRTSLHARGYRQEAGMAPLRESLAAAIVRLVEWSGQGPLVDPMCGSGTLVIEAARAVRGLLPGVTRDDYGFMRWPGFRKERYEAWRAELTAQVKTWPEALAGGVLGVDLDAEVIAVARENAARAGVGEDVRLEVGDARTVAAPAGRGVLVTNPPWGVRMGDGAASGDLLGAVADHWRQAFAGWKAAVLVPDRELARSLGLELGRLVELESGGRDVLLAIGQVASR